MHKTIIVILNWNGLEFLKAFLGIARICSSGNDALICVADNASTDGSADWVEETYPDVKVIRLDKNHGFAGGYNLALDQIEAQYFVLLNSDIEVTPGWLEPLVDFMDSNPDAASCQPKILSFYKKDQFEHAGAAGCYIDKYGYPFCRGRIFYRTEVDKGQYDSPAEIFWSSGACMIVRSEAWKRCGGFDPDFFAHMEEIDLCWRFSKAGYRVCFIPESVVYHVGGGALPYFSPFKTYLNFRNSLYLLYKNLPDDKLKSIMFIRKVLDGVAALFFLAKGGFRSFIAVWRAHIDFYLNFGELKAKREAVKKLEVNSHSGRILNKSIVFEFYIKHKHTYTELETDNLSK